VGCAHPRGDFPYHVGERERESTSHLKLSANQPSDKSDRDVEGTGHSSQANEVRSLKGVPQRKSLNEGSTDERKIPTT